MNKNEMPKKPCERDGCDGTMVYDETGERLTPCLVTERGFLTRGAVRVEHVPTLGRGLWMCVLCGETR